MKNVGVNPNNKAVINDWTTKVAGLLLQTARILRRHWLTKLGSGGLYILAASPSEKTLHYPKMPRWSRPLRIFDLTLFSQEPRNGKNFPAYRKIRRSILHKTILKLLSFRWTERERRQGSKSSSLAVRLVTWRTKKIGSRNYGFFLKRQLFERAKGWTNYGERRNWRWP